MTFLHRCRWRVGVLAGLLVAGVACCGAAQAASTAAAFAPLQQWKTAVEQGDVKAIYESYSTHPPVTFLASTGYYGSAAREALFWGAWKKAGLTAFQVDVIHQERLGAGIEEIFFEGGLAVTTASGPHQFWLFVQQTWQKQAGGWKIVNGSRTDLARLKQPLTMQNVIYPSPNEAAADIQAAIHTAERDHKRVLLDFGGNWCYDCHVLHLAFFHSDLTPLLEANYIVVPVNIGEFDQNLALAKKYEVPLNLGVPALAVLDSQGRLLTSQKHGEFEAARSLAPAQLVQFLNQWKP